MRLNLANQRRDPELAKSGRWDRYHEGIELRIASADNPEFEAAQRELLRPHLEEIRAGKLSLRDQLRIFARAIADHLLVGWRGVKDEGGAEVEFSRELARAEVEHEDADDLRNFIFQRAADAAKYRVGARFGDAGNSPTSSNGGSDSVEG